MSNLTTKPNQDRAVCLSPLAGREEWSLFFVADGHGPHGHLVSEFVSSRLPDALQRTASKAKLPRPSASKKSAWLSKYATCVRDAIARVAEDLRGELGGVSQESGCTLCGMWVVHEVGIVFNVGDSRALYVVSDREHIQITRDHKPDDEREAARIRKHRGYVGKHVRDSPPRLWSSSKMEEPGLALSRALGDFAAHKCGLTYLPAISTTTFTRGWVVIATDGLWDYVDNVEVAALSRGARTPKAYGDKIMARQLAASDGGYRDDCTVVVVSAERFAPS